MATNCLSKKYGLFVIALLIVTMALVLSGCGGNNATGGEGASAVQSLDRILADGVIKIAVPQDTPLFGTQAADGSYEGYDIDVANLLADELGVKLELVPVSSANRIPYLTSGRADLVVANMGVQPARAEVISFSKAYAPFFWAVYGTKDQDIDSIADTVPYKVGATLGTMEELAFTAAAPESVAMFRYPDQATTAQAFLSGQVDLLVTGNAIAAGLMRDNPAMGIESKFVMRQSPCHIGVRRGETALLNWVNAAIYSYKLNGTLDELSVKWFGEPLPDFPEF